MNQEQLKAVYFGYFDQLPEPWAMQAKANYNPERYQARSIVDNLLDSLECAFDWGISPQGFEYWNDIRVALLDKWNYLPLLPTDTSKVYEVACYLKDGSEWIMRCAWNGNGAILAPEQEAALNFTIYGEATTLYNCNMTPYAWREVPPVSIPPRPVNP